MTIVNDSFSGSGALGANWDTAAPYYTQGGGVLSCSDASGAVVRWIANTFSGDQYAKWKIVSFAASGYWTSGPIIKSSNNTTGYRAVIKPDWVAVQTVGSTDIIGVSTTVVAGDTIELRAVGDLITLLKNGTQIGSATPSTPLTGTYIGFGVNSTDSNGGSYDDFEGGDILAAATTTTLSGPSSGTVSVASTNFTVGANGTITGTVVVTPADGGAGGTFTPTTVSISSGTPTGTFTYTPASTGAKTISTTNNGSLSNPTSLTYTSNAAGDSTAPTLTSPTGTKTGSTTASGTVTTDEGNGTLYFMASTNATESAATVKAGATQAISSTGSKSVSFTGLTASTTYYAHYCHRDAAGNDSTVANSASFTTDAAPSAGTLTTPQPLKNNAVIVQPNLTGLVVHVLLGSSGAVVVSKTGQTTNASGYLVVTDAAITAGTAYFLAFVDPAANAVGMTQKITAV